MPKTQESVSGQPTPKLTAGGPEAEEAERQRAAAAVAFCGRADYFPVDESEMCGGPASAPAAKHKKK